MPASWTHTKPIRVKPSTWLLAEAEAIRRGQTVAEVIDAWARAQAQSLDKDAFLIEVELVTGEGGEYAPKPDYFWWGIVYLPTDQLCWEQDKLSNDTEAKARADAQRWLDKLFKSI